MKQVLCAKMSGRIWEEKVSACGTQEEVELGDKHLPEYHINFAELWQHPVSNKRKIKATWGLCLLSLKLY